MRFSHRGKLGRILVAAGATAPLVVGTGVLTHSSPVSAQTLTSATYSGRACAVMIQNLTILGSPSPLLPNGCLGDSGQVPAAGGVATAPNAPISVAGLIGAQVLHVAAGGANGVSNASTALANVAVLPQGLTGIPGIAGTLPITGLAAGTGLLAAQGLNADTSVDCSGPTQGVLVGNPPGMGEASKDGTGAASDVVGLTVANGKALTTEDRTVIPVAGLATITLNDRSYDAGTHTATANAIRVDLNVPAIIQGTIIIGHSESDLTGCVFAPKTAGPLPPSTGSAAMPGSTLGGGSTGANFYRSALLPIAVTGLLSGMLAVGWRRRRAAMRAGERQT